MMSKPLAVSIAASVLAMSAFVLLRSEAPDGGISSSGPRWSVQADSPGLPGLNQLIPILQ